MKLTKNTEYEFTQQVLKLARLYRWRTAHFRPGMMKDGSWQTPIQGDGKGFPDLVLVRDDKIMAIELKMKDTEPTDEQMNWLLSFTAAGVYSEVWRPEDLDRINYLLSEGPPKKVRA